MWRRPNSWNPGESISAALRAPSSQYHCVAVVVCRPVLSACEISPICALASATIRLTSVLLPAPLGPSTSVARSASSGARRARASSGSFFNAIASTSTPNARYGASRSSRGGERRQVALVEDDARRDPGLGRGDQGARQLRLAEHRLGGDDDQQLVDVGGERLGLEVVLAVEQVGARQDFVDHAFVARRLPADPVADDRVAALAAGMAEDAGAVAASTTRRRPCPETTLPGASAEEGDEGIGLGGADEVVHRDAAGRMGREADDAAVELTRRSGW